jgi:predicted RNase H-like HicB family nuclease
MDHVPHFQCLEVDVASQGDTEEQALDNLREALELYLEEAPSSARSSKIRHLGVNVAHVP